MRRIPHLLLGLLLGAGLAPAHAWKGHAGVRSTEAGEITDVRSGPGSLRIAIVEDDTGEAMVAVSEHLRRSIERQPGEDPIGARVRVTGTWEHGYLQQDRWAIRATAVEVLSRP